MWLRCVMNVQYAPSRLRHGTRALGLRLGINYENQNQTHAQTHNVDSNLGLTSWTHTEHHTGPVMAHIRSPRSNAPTAPPRIAFGPHLLGSPSSSSPSLPPRPSSPVYASLCYSPPRHHFAVADAGIRTPTQKARSRRVGAAACSVGHVVCLYHVYAIPVASPAARSSLSTVPTVSSWGVSTEDRLCMHV